MAKASYTDQSISIFDSLNDSRILTVLGADMFAEFIAVKVPGKVIWLNFDLAREMGLDVPPDHRLTPQLHQQLIDMFSYRALGPGESACGRPTITLYADKYGGDGVSPALGSGRGGFLPYGNFFLKGIGHTPLFKHDDPDDFAHSHGGLHMWQGITEAVFGELNRNLFSRGSARILALLDLDDYTVFPDGLRMVRAVAVRVANQLRPGHVLAKRTRGERSPLDIFIDITRETGQLVMRKDAASGEEKPDIKRTMIRIINDHALTAAEQMRWRVTHCALTTSNMQMDGGMIDLTTQRTNSRSAPMRPTHDLDPDKDYYTDYMDRAQQMRRVYRAVVKAMPSEQRQMLNAKLINIKKEMDEAYLRHLEVELLCATGIKKSVAERIRTEHAALSRRFVTVILEMTDLKNPSSVKTNRLRIDSGAVIDIFNLLQNFPDTYFQDPSADHIETIRTALRPIYKGNRFHRAKRKAKLEASIRQFALLYEQLMNVCQSYAQEYYGDVASMQASIAARAVFENRPINLLYRTDFLKSVDFDEASLAYKSVGNAEIFMDVIDKRILACLRRVDTLLSQGVSRRIADNGIELNVRVIDGIHYSVRAWSNRAQTCSLHVSIPVKQEEGNYRTRFPEKPFLTAREIQSLRYKYTTDSWVSSDEVAAQIELDEKGQTVIIFSEIRVHRKIGELQGVFYDELRRKVFLRDGQDECRGYIFVVPDKYELKEMIRNCPSGKGI